MLTFETGVTYLVISNILELYTTFYILFIAVHYRQRSDIYEITLRLKHSNSETIHTRIKKKNPGGGGLRYFGGNLTLNIKKQINFPGIKLKTSVETDGLLFISGCAVDIFSGDR